MGGATEGIEELPCGSIDDLARPEGHPHDPDASPRLVVEHVQTHISHVFLTPCRVYKLRKAVEPGFIRFGTRAERAADCMREVHLNQRLAPDVYLGVAPVERCDRGFVIGPLGSALDPSAPEHCVVMRRLPEGRNLRSLLEQGRVDASQVAAVAECVAHFHDRVGLGVPAPFPAGIWLDRIWAPVEESIAAILASASSGPAGDALRARAEEVFRAHAPAFEVRRVEGRAVDGHGDLHLEHVWLERDGARPIFVDCLEFSDELRHIDAAADVAFLAMDLCYRGREDLAWLFLSSYAELRDDYGLYSVVNFFMSYRAAVRAKVAALSQADPEMSSAQREAARGHLARHVALSLRFLEPPPAPVLLAMVGGVGSGKTTVARRMAQLLGAVHLRSDHLRGQIEDPSHDRYGGEQKRRVYAGLRARAATALSAGRPVVLDATFGARDERASAAQLAREQGVPFYLVEVRCDLEVARARLAQRAREGRDLSEAGPERLERSLRELAPIAPDETALRLAVDTTGDPGPEVLRALMARSTTLAVLLDRVAAPAETHASATARAAPLEPAADS